MYRPMPIDHTLKALERSAEENGHKLEDVPGYIELCEFLADIEIDGCSDKPFDKAACLKVLKDLIAYVLPCWVGHEIEFHQKCQPKEVI